ncbi:hypothetical protein KPL71_004244 [Citrus sinensis]|uniref:Uncharacterized protein n=1 Tax=Citrus sinensis TaxID=2711 RepID=A0ACB8N5R8_CITSI|nr:hypothetical protein KPL71_004244 [Citrus sinensis]
MDQYHYHIVQNTSSDSSEPETIYESNPSESNPSSSSSSTNSVGTSTDSESEYADITSILMATKTEDPSTSTTTPIVEDSSSDAETKASLTEPEPSMPPPVPDHSTKPSPASWFTFDDIPRHKWPARLQEFAAWIDLQGTKPNAQPQAVLREFMARSTGSLRDCHFAQNCPYKSAKAVRLIQHLQHSSMLSENEDVESNFLEQSEQDDQTAFIIAESSDSDDISVISTVQTINHVSTIPKPSLKMSILPLKFHKLVPVIGFIDTGADTSMIDPYIVASKLPDKDLLIGFDILHLVKNLFLTSSGVRYKQMFLLYTDTLRLYALSETPSPYSHISQKFLEFCPENHSQFHHPSPLWKNEQFFIHLPFKLGMSPSDLLLAQQECSQLLQQGLIEFTDSDWACQAFYVEKRSEIVRGKKRLVIDYQPLNSFLKDDKFPLPKIQTLFVHLQGARIFSKFDLKAGFWQLVAIHTSQLSRMLKQQCPPWGPAQTEAVQQLKVIAQSPPPLRIPTTGQRILQTDASDDYWSVILLEEINGVRHFCAHANRQFKDSEKNYHVIYKEILAVKYEIKNFEFHIISHKFLINMDNSSFPRIFDFKNKLLPDKQLLTHKNWFAKNEFTI